MTSQCPLNSDAFIWGIGNAGIVWAVHPHFMVDRPGQISIASLHQVHSREGWRPQLRWSWTWGGDLFRHCNYYRMRLKIIDLLLLQKTTHAIRPIVACFVRGIDGCPLFCVGCNEDRLRVDCFFTNNVWRTVCQKEGSQCIPN
jgi:hypothetical protein